jgi:hypothetical protein
MVDLTVLSWAAKKGWLAAALKAALTALWMAEMWV